MRRTSLGGSNEFHLYTCDEELRKGHRAQVAIHQLIAADSLRAADPQFGRYTTEWDGLAKVGFTVPIRSGTLGIWRFFGQAKSVRSAGVYF